MTKGDYLSSILRSDKTIFPLEDIALLWHETLTNASRVRLNYFVKKGALVHLRKGLYSKDQNYDHLELATRILTPSYVSFETVLAKEGLIFQYYQPIFVASYVTREIIIRQQSFSFRKIKNDILINSAGIRHIDHTSIASPERAFLDMLYVNPDYHFDNLRSLNWDLVFEILPVYHNHRLSKQATSLHV